jgi:hypothetical protein
VCWETTLADGARFHMFSFPLLHSRTGVGSGGGAGGGGGGKYWTGARRGRSWGGKLAWYLGHARTLGVRRSHSRSLCVWLARWPVAFLIWAVGGSSAAGRPYGGALGAPCGGPGSALAPSSGVMVDPQAERTKILTSAVHVV